MISYSYEDVLIREGRARRQLKARLIEQLAAKEKAMSKTKQAEILVTDGNNAVTSQDVQAEDRSGFN